MSTKKRLLILSACYVLFLMLFVIFLVISSHNWLKNVQAGLYFTYSVLILIFFAIMGVVTRLIICRIHGLGTSLIWCFLTLVLTLTTFNFVYSPDDIKAINGLQPNLSFIDDVGFSYVAYSFAFFIGTYLVTSLIFYCVRRYRANREVEILAEKNRNQVRVNNCKMFSVFNKRCNTMERYLVYTTKKGKMAVSSALIYYDKVELIAVDSEHHIFAMIEEPKRISRREFALLQAMEAQAHN